jgi:hypothetical protein
VKRLGFVIANDLEEYLAVFQNMPGLSGNYWTRVQLSNILYMDLLKIYPTKKKANIAIKQIKTSHKTWVLPLYSTGFQVFVSFIGEDGPPWIKAVN